MDPRQLVKDCLRGNPASQQLLYDSFAETMLGVCYRYTRSLADAEDVLQEGFIRVFRNLDQFRFEGELGAWIRRIMVHAAINFVKKNSAYKYQLAFSDTPLHPVSDADAEADLNAKELAALIRQLPAGYQLIFNLHAVEGYSHIEIGRMLGISDGTSRSQYARARALLISWIKQISMDEKNQSYART